MRAVGPAAILLLLAACSQGNAPADEVTEAAEKIAGEISPTPETGGKYAPRDDCREIDGATLFRQRLALAVEARDAEGVAVLAAEDVKLDFGGGAGRAELVSRLDNANGGLWDELDALLDLGCARNPQGGITLPWYFEQDVGIDPFQAMIVTGENVPLLAAADAKSKQVATVDWDAVELVDGLKPGEAFQQVKLGDAQGYIASDRLRSVIDYRLSASSRNGRWRITSIVAGD